MIRALLLAFLLIPLPSLAQEYSALEQISLEIDSISNEYNPPGMWGRHPDVYPFQTKEDLFLETEGYRQIVDKLNALPEDQLNRQDQISRSILLLDLEDQISRVYFKAYLLPFNAEGGFFTRPLFSFRSLPFQDVSDYEAYLNWLPTFIAYLDYNQRLLEEGMENGVMRPKVIVQNAIKLLAPWMVEDPKDHPMAMPLMEMPASIPAAEAQSLQEEGFGILQNEIIPAYQALKTFLETEYLPMAPASPGVRGITNGKAYYEDRVRFFTTLDMTPDSVYQLGLQEVERIEQQMKVIIEELAFEGSFADFIEFLRTDPQFYAKTPIELLSRASWLSKKAEGKLPSLFSSLYELPFTVEPVPDAIAPTYTGGRYVPGSRSGDRAGIYWVNTYNLPSRPLYTLTALTLHEAVPGHHLGMMRAAELTDLPGFRRNYYISAYGEGWGLYSEYLGEEMGMYETPYDLFGRYTYEMWRACRLVVDVGLHYKEWTRQEAVNYLASHTALSLQEVNTEIDRYIGWPGQAVSYKIGELTIKNLRKEAEEALGDQFDIKAFHEVILENGSVPLTILREEVEAYLLEKMKNKQREK